METLEIPKDVWSPISSLVRHGIYKNERSALINIIHDLSTSKMTEFESDMKRFEKKYNTEWKAYFTAYNYWKSIHEESSRWL